MAAGKSCRAPLKTPPKCTGASSIPLGVCSPLIPCHFRPGWRARVPAQSSRAACLRACHAGGARCRLKESRFPAPRYTYRDAGARTMKLANALAGVCVCARACVRVGSAVIWDHLCRAALSLSHSIYKGKEECRAYYHDVPGVGQQARPDERQRDSALFRCAKQ